MRSVEGCSGGRYSQTDTSFRHCDGLGLGCDGRRSKGIELTKQLESAIGIENELRNKKKRRELKASGSLFK